MIETGSLQEESDQTMDNFILRYLLNAHCMGQNRMRGIYTHDVKIMINPLTQNQSNFTLLRMIASIA